MNLKLPLSLLGSLIGSIVLGFIAGYVAMGVLPCEWFGSHFEGACGYGAMWASMGIGLATATASFVISGHRVISKSVPQQTTDGLVDPSLFKVWVVALIITVATSLIPFLKMGSMVDVPVSILSLAFFAIVSFVLVRRLKLSPFLLLIVLVPFVGTFVFALIVVRRYRAQIPFVS